MTGIEFQFKEIIKEAVREVIKEEMEKGTLATSSNEKEGIIPPKVEQIKPRDPDSIIRPKQLSELLSVSSTTLWRWESKGKLPKRIKLAGRAVGWRYGDIQEWLRYN
ncbi:MAG: AlpA family phage regulatory protein [Gracilimonas sp.]|nr:AlpA family phage regulatory protein [Gracilimonas sp.]